MSECSLETANFSCNFDFSMNWYPAFLIAPTTFIIAQVQHKYEEILVIWNAWSALKLIWRMQTAFNNPFANCVTVVPNN